MSNTVARPRLRNDRQTLVWLFLIAVTGLTVTLGLEQHGDSSVVAITLLALAFIKLRLVALDFMGVRQAPIPLRVIVELYAVVVFTVLTVLYFTA
jgi:hypothetical protein